MDISTIGAAIIAWSKMPVKQRLIIFPLARRRAAVL
jgi:hypothetical protein